MCIRDSAYATDPSQEAALKEIGVAGQVTFPPSPDPLVVYEGFTSSRVGYYAKFHTDTQHTTNPDGSSAVTVPITLKNTAPQSGPPSILLGLPTDNFPRGYFATEVHVYMPPGSQVTDVTTDGKPPILKSIQEEYGHPVLKTLMQAKAGATSTTVVHYTVPG